MGCCVSNSDPNIIDDTSSKKSRDKKEEKVKFRSGALAGILDDNTGKLIFCNF